ncbi:hypothetical protein BVY11_20990 [Pseudomonas amygdali pv. morsprunorum]|nr:hypothetical protein BVY11_20990 [Pseudomonas amygdali pv. morsprunorum]PPS33196.1 hypothetical protein BVY12_16730 [Pseudomonas amygdali pv. morsprunorum]
MKTVSFQGTQLSASQQRQLAFQRHVKTLIHPVLQQQVADTLAALDEFKKSTAAPFKPEKQWFLESKSHGTLSIADFMGFHAEEM